MMKKKLYKCLFIGLIPLVMIVVILFKTISGKTAYSSEYEKMFGKFTAKTASIYLNDKDNACYSPISLYASLLLSSEFLSDEARQQMVNSLEGESMDELVEHYERLCSEIEGDGEKSEVLLATALWVENDNIDNLDSLKKKVDDDQSGDVYITEDILESNVNEWFVDKTKGFIEDINYSKLDNSMLLTNTLYYSTKWDVPFLKRYDLQEFYLENGETIRTGFILSSIEYMKYKEEKDYLCVDVELEEGDILFVLPDESVVLQDIINVKVIDEILSWYSAAKCEQRYIQILLPDYDIEYSIYGNEKQRKQLGIDRMNADVLQKIKLVIDKNGINEEIGENMVMDSTVFESEVLNVEINRPFLYIIMKDGVPLFIGTVYNPVE